MPSIEYVSTDGIYASSAAYKWIIIQMHSCDQTDGETTPDAMRATNDVPGPRTVYCGTVAGE